MQEKALMAYFYRCREVVHIGMNGSEWMLVLM
jgi:hypothetical protein